MNGAESGLYKWFAEGAEERKYLSIPRRGGMRQLLGIYYRIPLRVHFFLKMQTGVAPRIQCLFVPDSINAVGDFLFLNDGENA